jgi:hypothetical protein
LPDTVLDEVHVGADTGRDLAGSEEIEEGNVLPENGPQVKFSDLLSDAFSGVGETDDADP